MKTDNNNSYLSQLMSEARQHSPYKVYSALTPKPKPLAKKIHTKGKVLKKAFK